MPRFVTLLFFALTATALVAPLGAQQVEIRLRSPAVSCFRKTIRIQDVAELSGGNPLIRQQLAALDLDEFNADRQPIQISNELVRYRAVMAGIDNSRFIVGGAQTTVNFSVPVDATRKVEQAMLEHLSETFQISIDSLELQLLTPMDGILTQSGLDVSSLSVTPQFPAELPIGNRTIELMLIDGVGRAQTTNVSIKVAVYRDLVMARQNISRGEILAEEKIERVRRPIDNPQVSFASYEQAIGKEAQSNIQQFALVKAQFLRNANQTGAAQFDVKRNAVMSIVIRRGPLTVTLKEARANENGRIGDYINFTNPKSQETVRARIVDASTAIIEL